LHATRLGKPHRSARNTHGVKVLDAVARVLVLPERRLVLLGVKLRLGSVRVALLELEDVDLVDLVRHGVELGRHVLDVLGDLGGDNHCGLLGCGVLC
jgi:hypothetical protein